ncbi:MULTISPECIES: hypothetical protein [unclassified Agarivorans]
MQKVTLAEFYGKQLSLKEYLNWFSTHPVNTIDVLEVLRARQPNTHGGNSKDWCPNIHSEKGFISISYLGDQAICCSLGKGQRYVYYKENEQELTILCGRWPRTETLTINKAQLKSARAYAN